MARSDYDIINLSLEHELNEWLAERGYAGLADNRIAWKKLLPADCRTGFI
ncbi:Uncharacterised protein [Escherichia coli]|nr:Uncharacterised protein [Escherichia coli]